MYWNQPYDPYFQQLHAHVNSQSQQIEQLKAAIEQLREEIIALKKTPPVVNNEYKFDLLKVERLEGTLNIGLNPNGKDSEIGELDVGQSMSIPQQGNPELYQRVQPQIHHYLSHDAIQELKGIEDRYQYPLEDQYRNFIIEDVRKQIDPRIQYYCNQIPRDQVSPEQLEDAERDVCGKVIFDIQRTFEAFIQNLPRGDRP